MKYVWGRLAYSRDKVFQINLSHNAHFSRAFCPRDRSLIYQLLRSHIYKIIRDGSDYIFIHVIFHILLLLLLNILIV